MARIADRLVSDAALGRMKHVNESPVSDVPTGFTNPAALHITGGSSSLMAINGGNAVPMRGILPVEQMTDSDMSKFFPYTAYFDRIPKYTYYTLFNTSR